MVMYGYYIITTNNFYQNGQKSSCFAKLFFMKIFKDQIFDSNYIFFI